MSRAAAGETIVVKPTSNIYTVLVICAVVVELVGIIAIAARHNDLFINVTSGHYLFF